MRLLPVPTLPRHEEKDDQPNQAPQYSWLRRQVERRNPDNALIRRWFKLADKVLEREDDSDKPEK